MNIKELIEELEQIEDKTQEVFVYSQDHSDRYEISMVDDSIEGYVDININDVEVKDDCKYTDLQELQDEERRRND